MKIGVQFYTLRDFCKTTEGIADCLKKVADMGYTTVQISGTCDFDAQWMKEQLIQNGLQCVITHTPKDQLTDPVKVCNDHKIFGCNNVGLGYYKFKEGDLTEIYKTFNETYGPVARAVRENGLYFMYHHHDMELQKIDGKTILRHLAEDYAPEELGFTLDTYWLQKGGADPTVYIREFAGRIPCIHLKDYGHEQVMLPVGEGNINFDRVFEKAEAGGTQYMLVEQDNCNGEDPFDCLRRSYEFLKAEGFE